MAKIAQEIPRNLLPHFDGNSFRFNFARARLQLNFRFESGMSVYLTLLPFLISLTASDTCLTRIRFGKEPQFLSRQFELIFRTVLRVQLIHMLDGHLPFSLLAAHVAQERMSTMR